MISTEQAFNELGVNAVDGTEFMDILGLSPMDIADPQRFSRFRSVLDFFKQFPADTSRFMIRKVTNGKNVDKLQYVWEYAELLRQKAQAEKTIERVRTEASAMGSTTDPDVASLYSGELLAAKKQLDFITKETAIYEK